MRVLVLLGVVACSGTAAKPDASVVIDAKAAVDAPPSMSACVANGIPGTCLPISTCYGSRAITGGGCPMAQDIECCSPAYATGVTCDPNAIPTPNTGLTEDPGDAGCPAGMAKVSTFCVDRYEASLVEGTAQWSPFFPPLTHVVRALSVRNAVPQAYIKQTEAAAACAAASKRLCTDVEWLRACQGSSLSAFPYGNTRQPGACNDTRTTDPAVELYGTMASWIQLHLDSPCLDQEANGLAKTGAHASCKTAEGVYDMMGNVQEWTSDPSGTLRGGDYVASTGCAAVISSHDTFYWDYRTGFRCCANATP